MLSAIMRLLPLPAFYPLRLGAARWRRGSVRRNVCVFLLKTWVAPAWRGRLARHMTEVAPLDAPALRFDPIDSMVVDQIYWFGVYSYEGIVGRVWQRLCEQSRGVLEVGGNIGIYAVLGGRAARGLYTVVEPVPVVAAALASNLRRNGLLERVRLLEAAVVPDATEREVALNIPNEQREAPVGAHLVEGVELDARSTQRVIRTRGIPFASLAAGCELIKIDAEGIEAALLDSARALLRTARPTLLVEVLPEAHRLASLLRTLALEAGYRITALPEFGLFEPVPLDPASFTAATPGQYNAKDVVLSVAPLDQDAGAVLHPQSATPD